MPGQEAARDLRRQQILRAAYESLATRRARRTHDPRRGRKGGHLFCFISRPRRGYCWRCSTGCLRPRPFLCHTYIAQIPSPLDRLRRSQREMNRLSSEPRRIRVFFDFPARRNPQAHRSDSKTCAAELDRYREAFRPIAVEVLRAESERFAHVSADGPRSRCGGLYPATALSRRWSTRSLTLSSSSRRLKDRSANWPRVSGRR